MPRPRKKRKTVDVVAVKAGRARGLSYQQIADLLGITASSAWYALNGKKGRGQREVPAGKRRGLYLSDEHWELLLTWAEEAGLNYSRMFARLIEREQQWREQNSELTSELEPVIPGA